MLPRPRRLSRRRLRRRRGRLVLAQVFLLSLLLACTGSQTRRSVRCLAQVYCRCFICLLCFAFAAAACCFLLLAAAALPLAAARCRSLASPSPAGAGRLPLLAVAGPAAFGFVSYVACCFRFVALFSLRPPSRGRPWPLDYKKPSSTSPTSL